MQNTTYTVPLSVFCFWIRGTFTMTDSAVEFSIPNRVFGCIPVGEQKTSIPFRSISGCKLDTWYSTEEFFAGVMLMIAAFVMASCSVFLCLFCALFALGIILSAVHTVFIIQNNGTTTQISVPFYGRKAMEKFERMLSATLCNPE